MTTNSHNNISNKKSCDKHSIKAIDINLIEIFLLLFKNFKQILILYFLLIILYLGYFYAFGRDYSINLKVNLVIFNSNLIASCNLSCYVKETIRYAITDNDKLKILNNGKVLFNDARINWPEIIFHGNNFDSQNKIASEIELINNKLKKYFLATSIKKKEVFKKIPFQLLTNKQKAEYYHIDKVINFYQKNNKAIALKEIHPLRPRLSDIFMLFFLSILLILMRIFFKDIIKSIREHDLKNNLN